jgi:hypothetical protein
MTSCLRLQDPRHIWVKQDDSPVVRRLCLREPLAPAQTRILCLASPWAPIRIEVDIHAWGRDAFDAELRLISCPAPIKIVIRQRRGYGRPMAG